MYVETNRSSKFSVDISRCLNGRESRNDGGENRNDGGENRNDDGENRNDGGGSMPL